MGLDPPPHEGRLFGHDHHILPVPVDDKRYCSLWSLLTTGDLFNVDMNYRLVPEQLNPYDYKAFEQYGGKAYSAADDSTFVLRRPGCYQSSCP